ncbi:MAG: hypothetical protein WDZ83_19155 [Rhizobiaceae bacterium]
MESYVAKAAPGHTVFHSNTLVDVGNVLLAHDFSRHYGTLTDIFRLISERQKSDGSWNLFDFEQDNVNVTMWCTSEYGRFMSEYVRSLAVALSDGLQIPATTSYPASSSMLRYISGKNGIIAVLLILLAESYISLWSLIYVSTLIAYDFAVATIEVAVTWWFELSSTTRWMTGIVGTVVVGIIVNLSTPPVSRALARAGKLFGRTKSNADED